MYNVWNIRVHISPKGHGHNENTEVSEWVILNIARYRKFLKPGTHYTIMALLQYYDVILVRNYTDYDYCIYEIAGSFSYKLNYWKSDFYDRVQRILYYYKCIRSDKNGYIYFKHFRSFITHNFSLRLRTKRQLTDHRLLYYIMRRFYRDFN